MENTKGTEKEAMSDLPIFQEVLNEFKRVVDINAELAHKIMAISSHLHPYPSEKEILNEAEPKSNPSGVIENFAAQITLLSNNNYKLQYTLNHLVKLIGQ